LYTLRIPFQLPPGQEIDGSFSTQLGNLVIEVCQEGSRYVLTVEGLESQQAAEDYLQAIWARLMWVLLQRNLAFQVHMTLQGVVGIPGPIDNFSGTGRKVTADGVIDVKRPVVYPSGRKLLKSEAFPVTAVISTRASTVCEVLLEGLSFPYAASVISDRKLKLAIELYGAHFTESSQNAKFLTLMMALEALASGKRKEFAIRRMIQEVLNGESDVVDLSREVGRVYKKRNKLVHEGELSDAELSSAITSSRNIVRRVLKAKFMQAASAINE
jgi:hypothetical protein